MAAAELVFEGLQKRFGQHAALDSLSFTAAEGRVTGLLGPNGAGKTTCLRILVGLVTPDAGQALICGRHYRELSNPAKALGVALEGTGFDPWRSGRAHLILQARAAGEPTRRVDELLEMVGLSEAAGRRVGGYSLGMKQRLSMAHALLSRPRALVLDEPTNGLDPAGVRWVRDVLRAQADQGTTVLVSSHMLAEVEYGVDDIVIVDRGRLLLQEPLTALLQRSRCVVDVRTPDAARLAESLESEGRTVVRIEDGLGVVDGQVGEVIAVAARLGVVIDDLRTREHSLEQAYFEVLASTTEGH